MGSGYGVRQVGPLVHCITNTVVANFTANGQTRKKFIQSLTKTNLIKKGGPQYGYSKRDVDKGFGHEILRCG